MKMKAEFGGTFLQARKCQRLPANHCKLGEKGMKQILLHSPWKVPANTLILNLEPPEL